MTLLERYRWWTIDHPILSAPFWIIELICQGALWFLAIALTAFAGFIILSALHSVAEYADTHCNTGYHAARSQIEIAHGARGAWICVDDKP